MLENLVKKHLEGKAITRYGNIKSAYPQKAVQLLAVIAQLIQTGQITGKISDEELKSILVQMQEQKKETKFK